MTFSISAQIQDGGQNSGNSTFFKGTTCNFSSTHRVHNLFVAGKRFFLEKSPVDEYGFFPFLHRNSRSRTVPDSKTLVVHRWLWVAKYS